MAEAFANNSTGTATSGFSTSSAPLSGTTETWSVNIAVAFPVASGGTVFHFADPAAPTEKLAATSAPGGTGTQTWIVTRGAEGTIPVPHQAGFTIRPTVTAGFLNGAAGGAVAGAVFTCIPPSGDISGATDTAAIQAAVNAGAVAILQAGATYYVNAPVIFPPGTGLVSVGKSIAYFAGSQPMPLGGAVIEVVPGFTGTTVTNGSHSQAVNAPVVMVSTNLGGYLAPVPAAPSLTPGTPGSLAAGVYQVQITYVVKAGSSITGETTASVSASATVSASGKLTVHSPIPSGLATGATHWFCYCTQANGGTYTRQQGATAPTAIGTDLVLSTVSSSGANPPSSNTAAVGSANQMFRGITIDGRPAPGSTINGVEAWGPVWGVGLHEVGVYGMPNDGVHCNSSAGDGTGKNPDFWQVANCHFAGNGGMGFNGGAISDSYFVASEATGCGSTGWSLFGADNIKMVGCKAEFCANGLTVARGGSSRPIVISGFGTDSNTQNGIVISGAGEGPVILNGIGLNNDGTSGTTFAGLSLTGAAHVTCTGLHVTTQTTSGTVHPSYGVLCSSTFSGVLQLDDCELYGGIAGISNASTSGGIVTYGPNVIAGTGDWTTNTLTGLWQPMTARGGANGGFPTQAQWARYSGVTGQQPRETIPFFGAVSNQSVTAGVMYLNVLPVFPGDVISNLGFIAGQTAAVMGTGPHWWTVLYDIGLTTMLRQSADQGSAAIATGSAHPLALSSSYTVPAGVFELYAGLMINTGTGGTQPTIRGPNMNVATIDPATGLFSSSLLYSGTNGTGLGATAPVPSPTLTLAANANLLYLGAN